MDVVMAWDVPVTSMLSPTKTEMDYLQPHAEALERLLEQMGEETGDVTVTSELVRGRPGPALCQWTVGAELLVIGAHGHGGGEGFHLGSVSNYCAHHAPCPVLIYRSGSA